MRVLPRSRCRSGICGGMMYRYGDGYVYEDDPRSPGRAGPECIDGRMAMKRLIVPALATLSLLLAGCGDSGAGFFLAGLVFFRASSLSRASLSKTKERSAFETNFFNMPFSFQALINTFKAPQ